MPTSAEDGLCKGTRSCLIILVPGSGVTKRASGVSSRILVHQDERGCRQFQRALDHLARIDRRMIDGADLLHLIGDQLVALVEKQLAKLLLVGKRHAGAAIADHVIP
jgi:hypothetical protein